MTSESIFVGDQITEALRRAGFDRHPDEVDFDVTLRGNYLHVKFHDESEYE